MTGLQAEGRTNAEGEVELAIGYDGEAVAARRMAVVDLAPAMLGIARLIEEGAAELTGGEGKVRVEVKADFQHGSFVFDIVAVSHVADVAGQVAAQLWQNFSLGDLMILLGLAGKEGLIGLMRRLRGRRVTAIERDGPRSLFRLEDGAIEITEAAVGELYQNPAVQENLELAMAPLRKPGYDTFFARSPDRADVVVVEKGEADYFRAPLPPEATVQDDVRREIVQVIAPNFKPGNKWVVALAGDRPFHVHVADRAFLDRVDRHEVTFGRGDALVVRMRTQVTRNEAGDFTRLREIVEVLEYIRADQVVQSSLFDDTRSGDSEDADADDPYSPD